MMDPAKVSERIKELEDQNKVYQKEIAKWRAAKTMQLSGKKGVDPVDELMETLLKKLMVNLNNTNELSTDMLYKLTDVFEMDAIEIFKEIKHLNNKP